MNDFINNLYSTLVETIRTPQGDPEYERAVQAYMKLEDEVKEKIGLDLLSQYQRAQDAAFGWEREAVFACGLHFGVRFMLEVLG